MSLWIKSHQDISSHPKTRKAARKLGITTPQMVGHLHMLWHWCLSYAPVGDISHIDTIDIADAVMWDGDENVFINALIEVGFIDRDGENICIHDWQDYGGKLVEQREREAERKRVKRANPEPSTEENNDAEKDVRRTSGGRPRNVRVQIREEKSTEEKSTPKGVGTENAPPKKNHEFLHPEKIPNIDSPLAIEIRKICKKPIYLSENDREKMREALVILESQNATVEQMKDFGAKVQFHWCGRDRQTKQRCPPGIMQVAENWQAVLAIDTTRTTKSKKHTEAELDAMAAKYA